MLRLGGGNFKGLSPSITPFGEKKHSAVTQNKNIKNSWFVNTKKVQSEIRRIACQERDPILQGIYCKYGGQTEPPDSARLLLVEVLHRSKVFQNEEYRKEA